MALCCPVQAVHSPRARLERAAWSAHGVAYDGKRDAAFRELAATWAKVGDVEGAATLLLGAGPLRLSCESDRVGSFVSRALSRKGAVIYGQRNRVR